MTEAPLSLAQVDLQRQRRRSASRSPALPGGDVLVRNSNHPDAGTLAFAPAQMGDWIAGCAGGDLDDLTS